MKFLAITAILLTALTRESTEVIVSKQHGCRFWSSLAYNLTHIHEQVGDIMHMVCENDNNTDGGGCQEMKCGGRFQQALPIVQKDTVKFNFCFGFRMNHCDDPVSMSYFFVVPDRNVTLQGKLTHDDSYEIPGGKFQGIDTTVIVTITMEKRDNLHLVFGIQGEVRAELLGNPIFDPKIDVFPPTLIDIIPCNASNRNKKPDPPFLPLKQCGLPSNYSSYPQWTTAAPKPVKIKSATYNKTCEVGASLCERNENCKHVGAEHSRNGICVCLPIAFMSPKTGYCELPLNPTTTIGPPATKTGPIPSVTQASKGDKKGGLSTIAVVVIGVVGGLLLIVVIASVIIYIGRRKRSAIYRDRHQLLTADDDDDVNLVI